MTRIRLTPFPRSPASAARRVALAALPITVLMGGTSGGVAAATPATAAGPTVVAWGEGVPAGVPSPAEGVSEIATSGWSTLVLGSDGRIKQDHPWGTVDYVPDGLTDVTDVAIAASHALALHRDGTVTGWSTIWGVDAAVPPADLDQVTAIAAGEEHGLALRSDGTLVTWGTNYGTPMPAGLDDVIAIDAAHAHSLALRADGTVVAWGSNYAGQLNVPADLRDVVAVSAGDYHNLALQRDGTVIAWGHNHVGQRDIPPGLGDVVAIDAGVAHNLAVRPDGTVVAWGWDGDDVWGYRGVLDVPSGLAGVTRVVAGTGASYAFVEMTDTTAPELSAVSDITVPAASQAGADVPYPVPAAGDDTDGVVPVTCHPAPGSSFPIGTTSVTCRATDTAGNTATRSFSVTVAGAAPQLADLRLAVNTVGPGAGLSAKVAAAQAAQANGDPPRAVAALRAFILQVRAQQGKSISSDHASALIADATRIQSVLHG